MPNRSRHKGTRGKLARRQDVVKALSKISETKFHDENFIGLTFAAVVSFAQNAFILTEIDQGTNQDGRTGNAIQVTGCYAKIQIKSTAINSNYARVILYSPRIVDSETLPADNPFHSIDSDEYVVWSD